MSVATCLWYESEAEQAARLYASLLPDSRVDRVHAYPADAGGKRKGETMLVEFTLQGQRFQGLNGGPHHKHSPAASISVGCETQAEIDRLWDALTADGGAPVQCGWLTDRWGVPWQITPAALGRWMAEPGRAERVLPKLWGMVKIDIATLEAA